MIHEKRPGWDFSSGFDTAERSETRLNNVKYIHVYNIYIYCNFQNDVHNVQSNAKEYALSSSFSESFGVTRNPWSAIEHHIFPPLPGCIHICAGAVLARVPKEMA